MKTKTADFIFKPILSDRLVKRTLFVPPPLALTERFDQKLRPLWSPLRRLYPLEAELEGIREGRVTRLWGIGPKTVPGTLLGALPSPLFFLIQAYGFPQPKRLAEDNAVAPAVLFIPFQVYDILQKQTLNRFRAMDLIMGFILFLIQGKGMFPKKGYLSHQPEGSVLLR